MIRYISNLFCNNKYIVHDNEIKDFIKLSKNYYLHGTNSSILQLLPLTNFCLMDPISMIEIYNLAPLTGMILHEFNETVDGKCYPSFGHLYNGNFRLREVLKHIEKCKEYDNLDPFELLKFQLNVGKDVGYSNINTILIYAARCQMLGYNISIVDIDDIKLTFNVFASLLFFDKYIIPADDLTTEDYDNIFENFTLEKLKDRFINNPDFYELYENRWKLDIKSDIIKLFYLEKNKPFIYSRERYISDGAAFCPKYTVNKLLQNTSGYKINNLFENYAKRNVSTVFWSKFNAYLYPILKEFRNKINLLSNLSMNKLEYDENAYPIILTCDNDNLMKLSNDVYHSLRPIKLGIDIKTIATDTYEHKYLLKDFLNKHNINCNVILFDELM